MNRVLGFLPKTKRLKILWRFLILLILTGSWYAWDADSRYNFSFQCPNPDDVHIFNQDSILDIRLHYQKYFGQNRFRFPRDTVTKVIVRKNIPLVSSLTKYQLSHKSLTALLQFLNNPDNFTWKNNTMLYSQADYIINFYDANQKLNGKLWLSNTCGTLKAVPFTPNMKFGHIRNDKLPVLIKILGIH